MNRQASLLPAGPLLLTLLIFAAALTRVLPHPPNFSPIEAVALFGGAYFAKRGWALLVPLVAMFASDLVLGLVNGGIYWSYFASAGYLLVYACISLAGSLLFFVLTNAGVWAFGALYTHDAAGLAASFAAGIPFFQWTVLGTLFYAALLFGGFELLRRHNPALHAQTV